MIEPIVKALEIAGDDLDFDGAIVKGFLGFSISTLYKGEQSLYETEIQSFKFQLSMNDIMSNQIEKDTTFTLNDRTYKYLFNIDRYTPDLLGWAEVSASYVSRELL